MSRRNGHVSSRSPVISDQSSVRMVAVELAEDDVRLLINVIRAASDELLVQIIRAIPTQLLIQVIGATQVHGSVDSLPKMNAMIDRLKALQVKMAASLKPTRPPLKGRGKTL